MPLLLDRQPLTRQRQLLMLDLDPEFLAALLIGQGLLIVRNLLLVFLSLLGISPPLRTLDVAGQCIKRHQRERDDVGSRQIHQSGRAVVDSLRTTLSSRRRANAKSAAEEPAVDGSRH